MVKLYNGEVFFIPKEFEKEIRTDERAKFIWCLEHFDYHMSREELIQKVKEFFTKN